MQGQQERLQPVLRKLQVKPPQPPDIVTCLGSYFTSTPPSKAQYLQAISYISDRLRDLQDKPGVLQAFPIMLIDDTPAHASGISAGSSGSGSGMGELGQGSTVQLQAGGTAVYRLLGPKWAGVQADLRTAGLAFAHTEVRQTVVQIYAALCCLLWWEGRKAM